jgi:hypothetical protein
VAITNIPFRLQVQRAISAALKEINPDNGYEFDLRDDEHGRARVVRGRLHIGEDEPLPMVSIVEPPMSVEAITTKRKPDATGRIGDWDIIIQGWATDDPQNPTDIAYQLESEVRMRLAKEKPRNGRLAQAATHDFFGFGKKILNMSIGSPVIRPNEYVSEQAVFYLVLSLTIAEDVATANG